jgi:hypothetical protein
MPSTQQVERGRPPITLAKTPILTFPQATQPSQPLPTAKSMPAQMPRVVKHKSSPRPLQHQRQSNVNLQPNQSGQMQLPPQVEQEVKKQLLSMVSFSLKLDLLLDLSFLEVDKDRLMCKKVELDSRGIRGILIRECWVRMECQLVNIPPWEGIMGTRDISRRKRARRGVERVTIREMFRLFLVEYFCSCIIRRYRYCRTVQALPG